MTQALAKTILTVKYVNPPPEGGKRGTIKTIDDEYFGVWPENMDLFQPGETYHVEYVEKTINGRALRNIKSAVAAGLKPAECPSAHLPAQVPTASAKLVPAEAGITESERQLVFALRRLLVELKGL